MNFRLYLVFFGIVCFWFILVARAAFLQVVPNERLSKLRQKQFERNLTIESRRGDIFDRNGQELAISIDTFSLFVDPSLIKFPKRVAKKLAKKLGLSKKRLSKKLSQSHRRFTWVKRQLDKETKQEIQKWQIRGIGFIRESKRVYPNANLLSQVLGFVGSEGHGLEGLELTLDSRLAGKKRTIRLLRDARGRPLLDAAEWINQRTDGSDIWLTIDSEIQFILEQELDRVLKDHLADSAVGVILDPRTSEVLAMANLPTYNLNQPRKVDSFYRRNRSVTDAFEPGSTLKTMVVAAGLRTGDIEPKKKYDCENGKLRVGRRTIREADRHHQFKVLTVSEILSFSSNIGSTKIAFDVGDGPYKKALDDFGFGQKTGIRLPGESKGIVKALPWKPHLLSNVSFGHGMTATPLQMANAYAAIANGGKLLQPRILKSQFDPNSGKKEEFKSSTIRRVLTPGDAEKMTLMLMMAVSKQGTGRRAQVKGFPVAGKTGTAQKVNPKARGYLPGAYISSFVGFFPVNDPRFVIYIAVDNPKKLYYGAAVAAPVFSRVAGFIARKKGLSPLFLSGQSSVVKAEPKVLPVSPASRDKDPLDLVGLSLREVLRTIHGTEIQLEVKGHSHYLGRVGRVSRSRAKLKVHLTQ